MLRLLASLLFLRSLLGCAWAVTVYGISGASTTNANVASPTATTGMEWVTSLAAYNDVKLQPPSLPVPMPPTSFVMILPNSALNMQGLSIPHRGDFLGFSIEMSVAEHVIGKNGSFIQVPFLNLMASVANRAGSVRIRVGGNTQETATLVDRLPNNEMMAKDKTVVGASTDTAQTPTLVYTNELLYLLSNVSSLVHAKWYLGIPMNDTTHLRLQIAEEADTILGDNVLGFQVGNEPDLFAYHERRPPDYNVLNYFEEFGVVANAILDDKKITRKGKIVAPSLQGRWKAEDLWNTGYLAAYFSSIDVISFEHYADNNCAAAFPLGGYGEIKNPQDVFPSFLTHANGQKLIQPYLASAPLAQQYQKEFMMFETNSASCGGFPGISDSFGSALWAVDYALQMAYSNFTGAMFHAGGQNVSYNPFTPPPTNLSRTQQWTVGPIFYSFLFMAEALGTTNTSRVVDLFANGGNEFTPGYAIYERDTLARVALVNFMTEQNGSGSYSVTLSVGGAAVGESNATPAQVKVKYLVAPSVSEKEQVTWANQTFGGRFQADGRLSGTEEVKTIACDQTAETCVIPVPAPGAALVFFSTDAQGSMDSKPTQTYATTAFTNRSQVPLIDPTVLSHSNGGKGGDFPLSGTSKGGASAAEKRPTPPFTTTLFSVFIRCLMIIF